MKTSNLPPLPPLVECFKLWTDNQQQTSTARLENKIVSGLLPENSQLHFYQSLRIFVFHWTEQSSMLLGLIWVFSETGMVFFYFDDLQ